MKWKKTSEVVQISIKLWLNWVLSNFPRGQDSTCSNQRKKSAVLHLFCQGNTKKFQNCSFRSSCKISSLTVVSIVRSLFGPSSKLTSVLGMYCTWMANMELNKDYKMTLLPSSVRKASSVTISLLFGLMSTPIAIPEDNDIHNKTKSDWRGIFKSATFVASKSNKLPCKLRAVPLIFFKNKQ